MYRNSSHYADPTAGGAIHHANQPKPYIPRRRPKKPKVHEEKDIVYYSTPAYVNPDIKKIQVIK